MAAQFSNNLGTWLPVNHLPGTSTVYNIIENSNTRFTVRDKSPIGPSLPTRYMRFVVIPPH
jgi:hypothetical protein